MNFKSIKKSLCIAAIPFLSTTLFANNELESLKKQVERQSEQLKELTTRLDITADAIDNNATSNNKTTIGGYGELHYNNLSGSGGASDKKEIDFHRFVLFFGHEFSPDIRFVSEFEIEHVIASKSTNGAVEVEQAYIDFKLNQNMNLKAGLFLVPIGIMNETHEPPTFYGVERNPVEKNILPSTWWEAGIGLNGSLNNQLSYDLALTSGLATTVGNNYAIRKGRQKVSNAVAEDLALTARLKWMPINSLTWAVSFQHQGDITQSLDSTAGGASLFETDFIWNIQKFTLKALFATWDLSGSGPKAIGANEQTGFYIEPSYRINDSFGIFARHNVYDNQAGANGATEKTQSNIGVTYFPHEDVAVKFDFQTQDNENNKDQKGFNLGIGYQF